MFNQLRINTKAKYEGISKAETRFEHHREIDVFTPTNMLVIG